jgi:hypothetical protein
MKYQNNSKDEEIFIEIENDDILNKSFEKFELYIEPLPVKKIKKNNLLKFMQKNFIINPDNSPETILMKKFKDYQEYSIPIEKLQLFKAEQFFSNFKLKSEFTMKYIHYSPDSNISSSTTDSSNNQLLNKKTQRSDNSMMKKVFDPKMNETECKIFNLTLVKEFITRSKKLWPDRVGFYEDVALNYLYFNEFNVLKTLYNIKEFAEEFQMFLSNF